MSTTIVASTACASVRNARPDSSALARPRAESAHQPVPFGGYAALMTTYGAGLIGLLLLQRKTRWPGLKGRELLLTGFATHEITTILTRDFVTSFLRAPFTLRESNDGAGEVTDRARGTGLTRALGELLTCPFCTAPWVATALSAIWVASPRAARLVCGIFAASMVSDVTRHAYAALKGEAKRAAAPEKKARAEGSLVERA